ncbi:hypothetical protein B7C62_21055 [Kitasatospora albolonga]|uniref:Lipoprotein n=1 Tax=Kitasatospora albolonga TaxID=68173 RepID=A0ABC8BWF4_9ACTN|nr:hypothetical protein B7C62_21055 [Kitasatospora albolonga]
MRRRVLAAAPLTAVLLISGCTGSADTGTPEGSGRPASPTASEPAASQPPSPSQPAPSDGTAAPRLVVPGKAPSLVPETSGSGNKDLPAFTPAEEIYTIYAGCSGNGSVTLVDRDNPGGEPHAIVCNDVQTVGVIHTEIEPQRLSVRVTGGATEWKIAVVSGDTRTA